MRQRLVWAALAAACLTGCDGGPTPVAVAGTVTLDGRPLAEGEIILEAADGTVTPMAGKIHDGRFDLKVLPGPKVVRILASGPTAKPDPVMGTAARESIIPPVYNTASKLTADVGAGKLNGFSFPLKSKP